MAQDINTVLVVDDDVNIRRLLEINLSHEGYEVITAGNGKEALEKAFSHRPDLVILDRMMPVMDGMEACRRLRENPNTKEIPIIMVTALRETIDKVSGLSIGADDYITKPFDPDEVMARVKTMLRRARRTEYLNPLMSVLGKRFTERDIKLLGQDLQVAHDIQMGLVPHEYPEIAGMEIGARMVPATIVGGDFYDFLPLKDGRIGLIIGDISGKGISAAMIMVMVRSVLRAFIMEGYSLRESLLKLNDFLFQNTNAERFLTVSYVILDPVGGERIEYGRAGHYSPIKYNTTTKEHQFLYTKGMPLGLVRSDEYKGDSPIFEEDEARLEAEDMIIMFTDGVSESMNKSREAFGEEGIVRTVSENFSSGAAELAEVIYNRASEHSQGELHDDITVLVVKKT
jgi:sigma-B regulation protein RsbU (phosphoserine phosphatase)